MGWKLKYSFAGKEEHALIYTQELKGFELVAEVHTPIKYSKFGEQKTIYYESKQKPIFKTLDELLDHLKILRLVKAK